MIDLLCLMPLSAVTGNIYRDNNYLSANEACSLIPILKNTGVTLIYLPFCSGSGNLKNASSFRGIRMHKQCLKMKE
jgi:hypothetical protein